VTVVLAVRCADGIVMGADTQVTDSDRGMSYPARKLHALGDTAAWGGSGSRAVLTELEQIFADRAAAILESDNVARELQDRMLPVLRHHYDTFIADVPGEDSTGTPSAYVLAAGYAHGDPFIVEINPNAMVSRYEDIGFHAIGSGAPMAQQAGVLLAHFDMRERGVDYGVVAIVRVLEALRVTAPTVGGEINVGRITPDGAHHLDSDDLDRVRRQVTRWAELEHQALDALFD
jgi:proteasome beta subunit